MIEERCECGSLIPRGYGFYNFGRKLKCNYCGRLNQRNHPETPKELLAKIIKENKGLNNG